MVETRGYNGKLIIWFCDEIELERTSYMCVICQDKKFKEQTLLKLPCTHVFNVLDVFSYELKQITSVHVAVLSYHFN